MRENNNIAKNVVKRTTLRSIGIGLISYGVGIAPTNIILGAISVFAGLVVLGLKDYLEER